jgi:trans-aconitate methyltransferase
LDRFGLGDRARLECRDALADGAGEAFDTLVLSEVLEHVEDPLAVLSALHGRLAPGGRLFVNVPINSPAPDHIYLLQTPEEAESLVGRAGFHVEAVHLFPVAGYTAEKALRHRVTVSVVVIASP